MFNLQKISTSSHKPALYDLLVVTAIFAVAIIMIIRNGSLARPAFITFLLIIFVVVVLIRLLTAFFGQLRYNPYSYNTLYYTGFALFVLFIAIALIVLMIHQYRDPDIYDTVQTLYLLRISAKNYILLTFPFLLIFSIALCVSNISLIRHEGMRFVNVLGIILAVLLVSGVVFLYWFDYAVSGSNLKILVHELISNLLAAVYLYFECMPSARSWRV